MKVEIWSDIQCPFCYIGKRRFEQALAEFEHKEDIQVEWKSFQLNPDLKTDPGTSVVQYLADHKGWTLDYARQMNEGVTQMAAEVGLTYNMDNAVLANTFSAHQLAHIAAAEGKGNEAEELLFSAYFIEGKNIADQEVLAGLGTQLGLDAGQVKEQLANHTYADAVLKDMYEAQVLNIRGVPFFVLNDKYAISGAQPEPVFLQVLEKAYHEQQNQQLTSSANNQSGDSCSIDGDC